VVRCTALCFGIALPLLAVAGCSSSSSSPPGSEKQSAGSDKKSPDLKWARSVAEDFLRAVKDHDGKAAYGLLAQDYRDRLTEKERKEGTFEFAPSCATKRGALLLGPS